LVRKLLSDNNRTNNLRSPAKICRGSGGENVRAYKFRLYPDKEQQKEMQTHLWLSKNLWNEGLELAKQLYTNYQKFPTRQTYQ